MTPAQKLAATINFGGKLRKMEAMRFLCSLSLPEK